MQVNFEVLGEVTLMGKPKKIALKFYADKYYNSAIDIGFWGLGRNLDFIGLGRDFEFKMGSEVKLNTLPNPQTVRQVALCHPLHLSGKAMIICLQSLHWCEENEMVFFCLSRRGAISSLE